MMDGRKKKFVMLKKIEFFYLLLAEKEIPTISFQ